MAERIQIFNGKKSKANLGELSFMFNGKSKKKKKSKGKRPHHNPSHYGHTGHKHKHNFPHRNPGSSGRESVLNVAAEAGGGALLAGLGSHFIAEQFLTAYNSGPLGWLVTAILGGAISWGGYKVFGGSKRFLTGGIAGTVLAVGYRVFEDIGVTPAKSVAADVRDAQATAAAALPAASSTSSVSGTGMGTAVPWPFKQPAIYAATLGRMPAKGQRALVRR